jgi:tetratricopeptide (TPR) repeat protein
VKVIKDDSGFFLVHYSIEPKKLSVDFYEDKYITNFDLNGRVSDAQGKTIFQYEKKIPVTLDKAELQDAGSKPFALQDAFPLVPGRYRLDLLLKNTVSKEFSSTEENIVVPQEGATLEMSPLLLGYQVEKNASAQELIPFKVGAEQILCQPRKTFCKKETLAIFFQVYGLSAELRDRGTIKFSFLKEDKESSSVTKRIAEFPKGKNFIQEQPLANFIPGYYTITVAILDGEGKVLLSQGEDFEITALASLPRPLIISKVMPLSGLEEYQYATGFQLLNQGKLEEAKAALEQAYYRKPGQTKYALGYSQILFLMQDYLKVKEILLPFADAQEVDENVLYFLGKASHSLGQFKEAIAYYDNYLSHAGMNIEILNLLGTCYYQLGNKKEALRVWQKSLEISPNQENIKKLVESLKNR